MTPPTRKTTDILANNNHRWIFGTPQADRTIMTPVYETEAELYSLFDRLMRYDEETGNTGEIGVYEFMRTCGQRTPVGYPEYNYNVILNTCVLKRGTMNNGWWAKFSIFRRRNSWDVINFKRQCKFYET